MPRNLTNVLNQIIELLPPEEISFKNDLDKLLYLIGYTPPEVMIDRWREGSRIINDNIPQPPNRLTD